MLGEGDDLFGAGVKIVFLLVVNGSRLKGLVALLVVMVAAAATAVTTGRWGIALHPVEIQEVIQRRDARRKTARHVGRPLHAQFAQDLILDDFQVAAAQLLALDARRAIGRDVGARLGQEAHQRAGR